MIRVETAVLTLVIFAAGILVAAAPVFGQAPGAPLAPVAVNATGTALDPAHFRRSEPASPIALDAPRVNPLPAGQVVAEDYRIGPQDLIEIQVFGIDTLKRDVRVNSRGAISLPLIGTVHVGGLSSQDAESLIAARYEKDFLRDPQVSVFIKEFTSQRITIDGAVGKPGVYPIRGQTSLLQAIALAGGQGSLADLNEVMVFRAEGGEKKILTYDVNRIRAGEAPDPPLVNDDVLVVKRSQNRVVLRDSLLSDFFGLFNPFNYLPH
jgi:polysaccharide export outer membrane protein